MKIKGIVWARIAVAVCTVLLAIAAVVTGAVISNNTYINASAGNWEEDSYRRYYVGGANNGASNENPDFSYTDAEAPALFGANGINPKIAAQLLDVLNTDGIRGMNASNPRTAQDFSTYALNKFSETTEDRQGGGAVYVRLFDQVNTGNASVNSFTYGTGAHWWQVVYYGKDTQGDDILTLYMATPYRVSDFIGSNYYDNKTYIEASANYSVSSLRSDITNDFNGVLAAYEAVNPGSESLITSAVRPMNSIAWQNENSVQAKMTLNSGVYSFKGEGRFNNPYSAGDLVWIPSVYETTNISTVTSTDNTSDSNRSGFWMLNSWDRSYNHEAVELGLNYNDYVWLRSAASNRTSITYYEQGYQYPGGYQTVNISVPHVGLVYNGFFPAINPSYTKESETTMDYNPAHGGEMAYNPRSGIARPAIHVSVDALRNAYVTANIESNADDAGVSEVVNGGENAQKTGYYTNPDGLTFNAGEGYKISTLKVGDASAATPTATSEEAAVWLPVDGNLAYGQYRSWLTTGTAGREQKLEVRFKNLAERSINVTVAADPINYNITYVNDKGGIVPEKNTYTIEDEFLLDDLTAVPYGRIFIGWTMNDVPIMYIENRMTGDITLTANYLAQECTVTFTNLKNSVKEPIVYDADNPIDVIGPPTGISTGYEFNKWYAAGDADKIAVDSALGGDIELVADWTLTPYTITYDLDGVAADNPNRSEFTIETPTVTLLDLTGVQDGKMFSHWVITGTDTAITEIEQGTTENISVTAVYDFAELIVNHVNLKGSTKTDFVFTVETTDFTDAFTAPTNVQPGYEFVKWQKDGADISTLPAGTSSHVTLTAVWALTSYQITYDLGGITATNPNPTSYNIETPTIIFENLTNVQTGKIFSGWDIDAVSQGSTGAKMITAEFSNVTYAVYLPSIQDRIGYFISNASASPVNHGGSYSFTLTITAGYSGDSELVVKANGTVLTPNGNIYTIENITEKQTVTVSGIELNSYFVVLPSGSGYAAYGNSSVTHGEDYKFTVTKLPGYSQAPLNVKYKGTNLTPSGNVYTIPNVTAGILAGEIMIEDLAVDKFTITFNANGGEGISTQTVSYHETVTKPINPTKANFDFVGWYTSNDFTVEYAFSQSVEKSFTLYAKWTPVSDSEDPQNLDVNLLDEVIQRALSLKGTSNDGKYTDASYSALAEAISNAQNVFNNPTSQAEIDSIAAALQSACVNLTLSDTGAKDIEDEVGSIIGDVGDEDAYTEESWKTLQDAINEYNRIKEENEKLAEELQKALDDIKNAHGQLNIEQASQNDMTALYIALGVGVGILLIGAAVLVIMLKPWRKKKLLD